MTTEHSRSLRRLVPLAIGVLIGAGATAGLVLLVAGLVRGDTPAAASGPPRFVEETDASGITHSYDGGFQHFVGGGIAVFDCNDDRLADLFFAGGSETAALYVNESEPGAQLRFTAAAQPSTDLVGVTGAYPLDVDGDGHLDLAVLRVGENQMLRGLGDCRFEPANEMWGIPGGDDWTVAFSATWEKGQSLPTLAFGNYLDLQSVGQRDQCASHDLIRPEGARYHVATELSPGWCTLSILFSDWSGTGRRDLRMTNDRHYYRDGTEQLWRIETGTSPTLYRADEGWETMQIWGMGIASHDLTGDGTPEVFLTSQGDNKLQTLSDGADRPTYDDIALELGVTAHRPFSGDTNRPSTAWHAEFGDVNNDGLIDLFVTKGNVESQPEFALEDPNNLLLGQLDGTFTESAGRAGVLDYARSRGGAIADLNLDGWLDMVVVERQEPVRLWRNTGADGVGNWLMLELKQPGSNPNAVGAKLEVRLGGETVSHEITVGGGHAGGESGLVHFGVGIEEEVAVRVIWPDGEAGEWISLEVDRMWAIPRDGAPSEMHEIGS
jgi:enediyne biosynthesis protein E4